MKHSRTVVCFSHNSFFLTMNETIHQTTNPSGLADELTIPTTPRKSKTTSNFNVCSDYDFHVEEERKTLFPRQSSLSFPIEHYCMMVEKVKHKT